MAGDSDFYQFATRFPAAALVLLGLEPVGDYVAEAVEVKRSRRIDLLLRPREEEEPGGVRAYVELQDYADPTIERRFLEEIVLHCTKDEVYRPVEAIVVYTEEVFRAAALPADIGLEERDVIAFRPRRIVLPELSGEALEAHGGAALIARPLVGDALEVERRAGEWLRSLQEAPLEPAQRQEALELFVRFLAHRLGTIDLERLLGEGAQVVEHTATGQALIAKGIERGIERGIEQGIERGIERGIEQGIVRTIRRVLETRFGSLPPDTLARLEAVHDVARLEELAARAAGAATIVDFARALAANESDPPGNP